MSEHELDLYRYSNDVVPESVEIELRGLKAPTISYKNQALSTTKRSITTTYGLLSKTHVTAIEAQGDVNGIPVFAAIKREVIRGDTVNNFVVWELRPENVGLVITLNLKTKNGNPKGEIFAGFVTHTPTLVRGATYDLPTGRQKETHWSRDIGRDIAYGSTFAPPALYDYWRTIPSAGANTLHGELSDECQNFVFPKLIDTSIIKDILDDEVLIDADLPWTQWFRTMGISFERIKFDHDFN